MAAGAVERPRRAGWRGHRCLRPSAGAEAKVRDVGGGGRAFVCRCVRRGRAGSEPELARGDGEAGPGDPRDKGCALPFPESALSEVRGRGRLLRLRRGLSASRERRVEMGGIGGVGWDAGVFGSELTSAAGSCSGVGCSRAVRWAFLLRPGF